MPAPNCQPLLFALPLHDDDDDDVSFYNSTASTWTLATPRTTWDVNYLGTTRTTWELFGMCFEITSFRNVLHSELIHALSASFD